MKRLLIFLIGACLGGQMVAQDKFNLAWHGFVNPVVWADSRQVVSGREGMMLFFPKPVSLDSIGRDLNEEPNLNMLAITARVNLTFSGPDVLGARLKGFIEGDFTGATDATINMLRLRHAYLNMDWEHHSLLLGQYWYPMVIHEIMPMTQPLNMGAPFHAYARYTQARYTAHVGHWEAVAVAAFQLDNKSQGPEGASTAYLRRSMVPEMNVQLRYNGERLFAGVAANLLVLKPRSGESQRYASTSFSLFGKYRFEGWDLKAQALLSDNLYEGCTMGGYVETMVDGAYTYKPFNWTTVWLDFSRNKGHWCPAIFLGYGVNNNFGDVYDYQSNAYGRGFDMQSLWRVQPRLTYVAGHGLSFMFDVECTHAQYGLKVADGDAAYHYETDPANAPSNIRLILGAQYDF